MKKKKKNLNVGLGERKVPEQELRSGLRKGKKIKANLPTTLVSTGTEKEIPSVHHPSRMVLVHCGQCKDGGTVQQKIEDLAQKWKILLRNGKSC
jgi:hypothetical protein